MQTREISERQAQLVDVAMRILASEGPRRFTAQHLAEEVGVTPGAIYNHFASMDAIVDAVVDRMGLLLFEEFPPQADDPIERLRLFFHRRVRLILGHPHLVRLLLSDHLTQAAGTARAARAEQFKQRTQQFIVGCLREASSGGGLHPELSPEAGAVIVRGAILSLSHAGGRGADPSGRERLFDEVWTALERMLRHPGPGRRPATSVPRKRQNP